MTKNKETAKKTSKKKTAIKKKEGDKKEGRGRFWFGEKVSPIRVAIAFFAREMDVETTDIPCRSCALDEVDSLCTNEVGTKKWRALIEEMQRTFFSHKSQVVEQAERIEELSDDLYEVSGELADLESDNESLLRRIAKKDEKIEELEQVENAQNIRIEELENDLKILNCALEIKEKEKNEAIKVLERAAKTIEQLEKASK